MRIRVAKKDVITEGDKPVGQNLSIVFKKNKLGYAAAYSVIFFILVGIFTAVLFKTQKEQIFGEGE